MALLPFDCVSDSAVSVVTLLPVAGSVQISSLFFAYSGLNTPALFVNLIISTIVR